MRERLKLGMVGGGRGAFIGAVHRMAARLDDQYELVAGALSGEPERALASAREAGIDDSRSYADWRAMAVAEGERRRDGRGGIDVVSIVTPNHLHVPVARAFLSEGIHVICDKPLALSLEQALDLREQVARSGLVFALAHAYAGYPMVRHARDLVSRGDIGEIRLVQVEYPQDWWAESGAGGDGWRGDPRFAGPAGTLGDVGTHAYHLASYVSGMRPSQLSAELHTFVPGRRLDDHVQVMMRYANGARGMLWASQVATGCENALALRVYGTRAQLSFRQENPDELWLTPQGGAAQRLTRGRVHGPGAEPATRLPAGHPEGYIEAFAQLYRDAAAQIRRHRRREPDDTAASYLPGIEDGVAGHRFIEAVLESHGSGGAWVRVGECA
jgi:predicted dehydrogenase